MKNFCLIIFLLVISLITLPLKDFAQDESQEELKLFVGEVKMVPVNNPTKIIIGNPRIADVTDVSKTEMTLSPKIPGTTTLVFWDNYGEQSYKIRVMAEDMTDAKSRIDNLLEKLNLPQVYTQIAEEESRILLLGRVKNAQDKERINTVIGSLKDKTTDLIEVKEEESVVEIDVQVVELSKDATTTLGFSWPGSIALTDVSGPTTTGTTGLTNVFHVSDFTRSAFNISLDALIQEGNAKILSRPRLACQSGKEAELLVGGEKPIFTTNVVSGGGTGTNIEYKEFGIKLKIKPTVMEEKKIRLALNMEVSEVGTAEFIGLTSARTAQAYPLSKRNASTELILNDGQTMAIGGLMKQKTDEDIRKTPGLGDLPILGALFRKKTTKIGGGQGERGDTELFITLTPTIVHKETPEIKQTVSLRLPQKETIVESKDIPAHLANYARAVQTKIIGATYYPRQAQDAGWEGNVKLSLNITSNGDLKDVRILESSGYKVLDDAAQDVAQTQAPYPPFPPQIDSQEIWVDVPIVYKRN
jgi:pilus assembly protein CpaC